MMQSHVIEVSGTFVGAAVVQSGQFRFVAVDNRVKQLNNSLWSSLSDVHRGVRQILSIERLSEQPVYTERLGCAS